MGVSPTRPALLGFVATRPRPACLTEAPTFCALSRTGTLNSSPTPRSSSSSPAPASLRTSPNRCNGVAPHLYQQTLKDVLERWHERLGKRFALFVRNGVAAHLADPQYRRTLTAWCRRLRNDYVTLTSDGIAARLIEPAFCQQLAHWHSQLSTPVFAQFILTGIAAHLGEPAVDTALSVWRGVALRIHEETFRAAIDHWHRLLGVHIVPFMCTGVAMHLRDPVFHGELMFWYDRLASPCSRTSASPPA